MKTHAMAGDGGNKTNNGISVLDGVFAPDVVFEIVRVVRIRVEGEDDGRFGNAARANDVEIKRVFGTPLDLVTLASKTEAGDVVVRSEDERLSRSKLGAIQKRSGPVFA